MKLFIEFLIIAAIVVALVFGCMVLAKNLGQLFFPEEDYNPITWAG